MSLYIKPSETMTAHELFNNFTFETVQRELRRDTADRKLEDLVCEVTSLRAENEALRSELTQLRANVEAEGWELEPSAALAKRTP